MTNTIDRAAAIRDVIESLKAAATDTTEVASALAGANDLTLALQARILGRLAEELREAAEAVREAGRS